MPGFEAACYNRVRKYYYKLQNKAAIRQKWTLVMSGLSNFGFEHPWIRILGKPNITRINANKLNMLSSTFSGTSPKLEINIKTLILL